MNRLKLLILLVVGSIILAGFGRLGLDVNVFNLLPNDSPMVAGMRLYQQNFGSQREMIISVRAPDAGRAEAAVRSLAVRLESSDLASQVIWRSPLRGNPEQLAEMLAYLWYNLPPEDFDRMRLKLQADQLGPTLTRTLERMATSFRPLDIARLSHDPFALTDLPARVASPLAGLNKNPLASPDGAFRILFATAPFEKAGFWVQRRWVAALTRVVDQWQHDYADGTRLKLQFTGAPVFLTHTGSGLMRDMLTAALGTMLLVAALFWLVHRKWRPLLWLVILQVFILIATMAVGGLFMGKLNAVSLGFAAILLGLTADYALILYQEYLADPGRPAAVHRAAVMPSILWAAATTAGAFFLIGRSSLPGLTQLGTLVAIGILIAVVVILALFLWPLTSTHPPVRIPAHGGPEVPRGKLLQPRPVWTLTLVAAAGALIVLFQQLPVLDPGTRNLGPKNNPAQIALDEIKSEIGGFDDLIWLIISGANEREVALRLDENVHLLEGAVKAGLLASYDLPIALWPRPDNQAANRTRVQHLQKRFAPAKKAALEAGFTGEALQLTEAVFAFWERFADSQVVVRPSQPGSRWIFRKFVGQTADRQLVLGKLKAAENATRADLEALAGRVGAATGGQVFGWSLLSGSLMAVMKSDLHHVLIPMAAGLLLLLGLAFRNPGEIALSILTMVFSLICLMSLMVLLGWSWNLMNVMALPLLFGAGVDYSIHIQFALRRCSGDLVRVRRTVGRAILLCAASTAAGFGTLGMATNIGVASLGRVCAVGIVLTCITSVYLLPVWWQTLPRNRRRKNSRMGNPGLE